jgi:hypothetical protein
VSELLTIIVGFVTGRLAERYLSRARRDHAQEMAYLTGHVDGYSKAVADSGEVAP